MRQFSAADGSNPLAQFQRGVLHAMKSGNEQQVAALDLMRQRLSEMQVEIARLHAEREKHAELAAEAERGTAKGRTFEESVTDALDRIALAQGDDCEAVGDFKGTTRRTGDVVVAIEGCRGPARGRIVFEAKTAKLGRRAAMEELDRARASATRTTPSSSCPTRTRCRPGRRPCASSTATSSSCASTPRRAPPCRSRWPTRWPAPVC